MTLGEFRKITKDYSDECELHFATTSKLQNEEYPVNHTILMISGEDERNNALGKLIMI